MNLDEQALSGVLSLLLEDRVDRIKRMYEPEDGMDEKIDALAAADPTNGQNKYLEWAAKEMVRQPYLKVKDVIEALQIFHEAKQDFHVKNLFDYKGGWRQFIAEVEHVGTTSFALKNERPVADGATMILDKPGQYFLVRAHEHEASTMYACGGQYCVADEDDHEHWHKYGREGSTLYYFNVNKKLFKRAKKRLTEKQLEDMSETFPIDVTSGKHKEFSDTYFRTILFNFHADGRELYSPHDRQNKPLTNAALSHIFSALFGDLTLLNDMRKKMKEDAAANPVDPDDFERGDDEEEEYEDLRWDEDEMEGAVDSANGETKVLHLDAGGVREWDPGDNEEGPTYYVSAGGTVELWYDPNEYVFDFGKVKKDAIAFGGEGSRYPWVPKEPKVYIATVIGEVIEETWQDLHSNMQLYYRRPKIEVNPHSGDIGLHIELELEDVQSEDDFYRTVNKVLSDDTTLHEGIDKDHIIQELIVQKYLVPKPNKNQHLADPSRLDLKNIEVLGKTTSWSGQTMAKMVIKSPAPVYDWSDVRLHELLNTIYNDIRAYFETPYFGDLYRSAQSIKQGGRQLPLKESPESLDVRSEVGQQFPLAVGEIKGHFTTDPNSVSRRVVSADDESRVSTGKTDGPGTLPGGSRPNEVAIEIALTLYFKDSVHASIFLKILDGTIAARLNERLSAIIKKEVFDKPNPRSFGPDQLEAPSAWRAQAFSPASRVRNAEIFRRRQERERAARLGPPIQGRIRANEENKMSKHQEREAIVYEMKLRKIIQQILEQQETEYVDRRKYVSENIRGYVRKVIAEDVARIPAELKYVLERSSIADSPHRSTGINVLEDLLKKIVPILEEEFKLLTTDADQRQSFRAHIINAVQRTLAPSKVNIPAPDQPPGPVDEVMVVGNELLEDEEDVTVHIEDEPSFDTDIASDPDDKEKFIDIDGDGKADDLPLPGDEEEDTFTIPDEEETGRNFAARAFNKIEKQVQEAFTLLANDEDREVFYDYLITNLKLYFDKFEDELTAKIDEPEDIVDIPDEDLSEPEPPADMPPEESFEDEIEKDL